MYITTKIFCFGTNRVEKFRRSETKNRGKIERETLEYNTNDRKKARRPLGDSDKNSGKVTKL